jgi:tripartite-type tricarboxylate transporter receptor subunit TctC
MSHAVSVDGAHTFAPAALRRRPCVFGLAVLALSGLRTAHAQANTWPRKPIRMLVAYPPGGVSDQVARELAERLAQRLGTPVLVENRPGASGTLAMEALSRSEADAHTLCFAATTAVTLMRRSAGAGLPVRPVAGVMRTPVLVVGTPALAAKGFAAMLALARDGGPGIRWATTGAGTTGHLVLERVRRALGKDGTGFIHIPYQGGGQQLNDALGGHFEVLSTNVAPHQLESIRAGRLQALAVGAPARLTALPDVPTLAELGFADANLDSIFGLFAPLRTPPERVQRIHAEVADILREERLRRLLLDASNTPVEGSPEMFSALVELHSGR